MKKIGMWALALTFSAAMVTWAAEPAKDAKAADTKAPAAAAAPAKDAKAADAKAPAASPGAQMVTVTDNGKSYHKADCSTIKSSTSKKEVTLSKATEEGKEACSVCKPAVLVYVTADGKKYHKADCQTLKKSTTKTEMLLDDAKAKYGPCGHCFKEEAKEAKAEAKAEVKDTKAEAKGAVKDAKADAKADVKAAKDAAK